MPAINIFCSWAYNSLTDKKLIGDLEKHLSQLQRDGKVTIWHAHKTSPGADLRREVLTQLKKADIILLCISPDYMASDDCIKVEASQAMWMQDKGIACVRVILLRPIAWEDAPFHFCRALPRNGKFVSKWPDRNEAFQDIVQDIKVVIQETLQTRNDREARRAEHNPILSRTHIITVMPPVESIMKKRQTDDIQQNKRTDDIKPTRQTDEIKATRRTEGLKQKRTSRKVSQNEKILADEASLGLTLTPRIKPLPKPKRRNGIRQRERSTQRLRSTGIRNWLNAARKEYRFMSKGYYRIFFYSVLLIDATSIAAAVLGWSNSWVLFWLALFIALLGVVVGAVNTDNLIPIPLALLYAGIWGIIVYHYLPWNPFGIISVSAAIAFIHLLLFSKHYR